MSVKNRNNGYRGRMDWNQRLQALALRLIYPRVWPAPDYEPIPVDRLKDNPLATAIDIGGTDKIFKGRDGHLILVADRFRTYADWASGYQDFTVRDKEYWRHMSALERGGMIPGFYVYAYGNESDTDFAKVYIVRYRDWLEDIRRKQIPMPYLKDMRGRQENFRYVPWRLMNQRYILMELTGPLNGDDLERTRAV